VQIVNLAKARKGFDMDPTMRLAIVLCLTAQPFCLVLAQTTVEQSAPKLSPSEVLQNKEKLLNNEVGVLENAGTNFFTDARLVIRQPGSNDSLIVKLRVPLETIRPSSGQPTPPTTKSDLLGKKVKLQGILKEEDVRGVGRATVLESTQLPTLEQ
jgi:hypothetical protein